MPETIAELLNGLTGAAERRATIAAQLSQTALRPTKTGKPYLEVHLSDATAALSLRIWENSPIYPKFRQMQPGTNLALSALWVTSPYGPEATEPTLRPLTDRELENMLLGSTELRTIQEAAWQTVCGFCDSIKDPRLDTLCHAFLEQNETRFRRAAAARGYHHARRGGLVEHTAGVMRCAAALCDAYPQLNRDLVLAGALLHDCGKMWENGYPENTLTMAYTDAGELLGHIPLGIEVVNKLWGNICTVTQKAAWDGLTPPTEQVRLHLLHLIASHHGTLEFGSPVPPKTPEAFALHHADDFDAKMEMLRGTYANSPLLSARIHQRKPPLPGNAAAPLPHYSPTADAP